MHVLRYLTRIIQKNKLNNVIQTKKLTHAMNHGAASDNIVWIDLEMTGLNIEMDRILEIACLVTDKDLNIISKGSNFVINQPQNILDSMNDWCKEHHNETGLTEASNNSNITERTAEFEILEYIAPYTVEKQNPLAGNSIYMDRLFLMKYMPTLNEYLSYRIIDVSSIKELCKRWDSKVYLEAPKKRLVHRAVDDIQESISELNYYKQYFFNK